MLIARRASCVALGGAACELRRPGRRDFRRAVEAAWRAAAMPGAEGARLGRPLLWLEHGADGLRGSATPARQRTQHSPGLDGSEARREVEGEQAASIEAARHRGGAAGTHVFCEVLPPRWNLELKVRQDGLQDPTECESSMSIGARRPRRSSACPKWMG